MTKRQLSKGECYKFKCSNTYSHLKDEHLAFNIIKGIPWHWLQRSVLSPPTSSKRPVHRLPRPFGKAPPQRGVSTCINRNEKVSIKHSNSFLQVWCQTFLILRWAEHGAVHLYRVWLPLTCKVHILESPTCGSSLTVLNGSCYGSAHIPLTKQKIRASLFLLPNIEHSHYVLKKLEWSLIFCLQRFNVST
jgi:hypothetical protein